MSDSPRAAAHSRGICGTLVALLLAGLAGSPAADDVRLPRTVAWSAYPTGTQGYSQAVAIGSVLQREYRTNLRVIPGRNDVSRLATLRAGRVQFSAGGSEAVYAQEALLNFASPLWGPQPLRLAMWSIADSCSFSFAAAADSGIETVADMRGRRLTWVQGAPSLNNGSRTLLAYAGLDWNDVVKVEVGGYPASVDAVINDRADVVGGGCNSPPFLRLEASPRGLRFLRFPHDDEEAVQRVLDRLPWYIPHLTTEGPTVPPEGLEVFTSPYPMLVSMDDAREELVYSLVKAIHLHFERYKDNAPGANGWALERQHFERAFVPYHEGAIRYWREIGAWDDAAQARHEANLKRQTVLRAAWEEWLAEVAAQRPDEQRWWTRLRTAWNAWMSGAATDAEAFEQGWLEARRAALESHGMVTIIDD
ncbi:MAG: TAXI family TRAP transporter solute-binding subunit [Gammaproteobacteria bacterium]|nr:TAXI family TRAP transporter solute-binding subunit [Gammaproteobacteria bacterium]